MKKRQFILVGAIFFLFECAYMQAQVTIGTDTPPIQGALLDLKQYDMTSNYKGATSDKGLLMPRIELSLLNTFLPVNGDPAMHIGLSLYNVKENDPNNLCKGLYTWDGTEWQLLINKAKKVVKDHEGNEYKIAYFGNAGWWMVENMCAKTYPDGRALDTTAPSGSHISKSYGYSDNDINNFLMHPEYGLLYSFSGATDGMRTDSIPNGGSACNLSPGTIRGICPQGWVIPSDNDWTILEQEIITNWKKYSVAGTLQPNPWDASWCTSNTPDAYHGNHGIIFKSYTPVIAAPNGAGSKNCKAGFNALLAGRLAEGGTAYYGTRAYFWTSTRSDGFYRWYRSFGNNNDGIRRARVNDSQYYMSVRCKKKDF
ncbi:MAG: fibrobacter succinogenes major paralogous domain-containing protein [Prevotella sp.]|jgi:uncharacterized protein (TIGR02145 family)|nr:fibrobacter succinogenes major paralogous domain-containing protein [Prevotella sp.]